MRFVNPIPFVRDINVSKQFYANIIGLDILEDHGNFVLFASGFAIHDGASLHATIWKNGEPNSLGFGANNLLLYFEDDDIRAAFSRIAPHVDVIHPIEKQSWGQQVFRFYDPDRHLVEVGEVQV